jgi:hypothetical protein
LHEFAGELGVVGILAERTPAAPRSSVATEHIVRVLSADFGRTALDHEPESVAKSLA